MKHVEQDEIVRRNQNVRMEMHLLYLSQPNENVPVEDIFHCHIRRSIFRNVDMFLRSCLTLALA